MSSPPLTFFVNGKKIRENKPNPEQNVLQYLRGTLQLHGTKNGCDMGGCGSCTVMLSHFDHREKKIRHRAVNACLVPLCTLHGMAVTTVEGIGSIQTGLHPVQDRLAKSHGTQCGYCSPGMVMSMCSLLREYPQPSQHQIEVALEGNLCRCTGYRPILDAFRVFSSEYQCELGDNCCLNQNQTKEGVQTLGNNSLDQTSEFVPSDPSQDVIFPSELQLSLEYNTDPLEFTGPRVTWFRPTSLASLLDLKAKYPQAMMVVGSTDVGLQIKLMDQVFPVMIAATHIPELKEFSVTDDGVHIGASVTFSDLEKYFQKVVKDKPEWQTGVIVSLLEALQRFTCFHIRNIASLGGNIVAGSTESFAPLLMAAGAELTIIAKDSELLKLKLEQSFYKEFKTSILKPEEVLLSIYIPFSQENEYYHAFHSSERRSFSRAVVNTGMCVKFHKGSNVVKELSMSFGGIGKTIVTANKTMRNLVGQVWDNSIVENACSVLAEELPLKKETSTGKEEYRLGLAQNFFFKFYCLVAIKLQQKYASLNLDLPPDLMESQMTACHRQPSCGSQVYEQVPPGQPLEDAVGRPLPHASAQQHVTGEAQYVNDIPSCVGELFASPVLSTKAHAWILEVDTSDALAVPGVVDYVSHKDVPGTNLVGVIQPDEEVFASEKVVCHGQVIGLILANSQNIANQASLLVHIRYEELEPLTTIEEAIEANSFLPSVTKDVHIGNMEDGFAASDHIIEGEVNIGSQEHFYLETHASLIVPKGDLGELEIFTTTHNPPIFQETTPKVLGVSTHKITMRIKRVGGSFGGKQSRQIVVLQAAVVAAFKWRRPVRYVLDRVQDMKMTGGRHPFLAKYKIGVKNNGELQALEVNMYANAGCSLDVSPFVLECALEQIGTTYRIPNLDLKGHLCKTNLPSNTAMRGFGHPQGYFIMENCLTEAAAHLRISQEEIHEVNINKDSDFTSQNHAIDGNLQRCWTEAMTKSDFHNRKLEAAYFNRKNKWKKKGISILPQVCSIGYPMASMMQGAALVHIYKDGSVLLSHGGVEIGQGLHTKMIQVASRALQVPVEKIFISETNTSAVPNTSPTSASCGSDLYGMAVLNACEILTERLKPYREADPQGGWEKWVMAAYMERVSLSSTGFWKKPGSVYDCATGKETMPLYFSYGAAVSEVEIDCLTGEHVVQRVDIVMDVGTSLNPAIDIGQIEGAFLQGYGLYTMEVREFSPRGVLQATNPLSYKIPTVNDIPVQFNVSLLKESANPKAVYSSKGIGEPPLLLGGTVFFAIKSAIAAAREDAGLDRRFRLDSPATSEKIFKACGSLVGNINN